MKLVPSPPPPGFRESIAATYDAVAAQREEMGEASWRWPIAEQFLGMLRERGLSRMLEIGAGVGFTSRWFADRGIDVVATDLSPGQVALCRGKGLEAHVRDMYRLDFPDESFGAVWMMNCIHHVPPGDLAGVLAGVAAVVQPGGLVYLGVWGGVDEEGMPEDDFYQPPRYFCFRSDDTLLRVVGEEFDIISFDTFFPEEGDDHLHMQSLVMERR
ncbi:MAG: class I SAM-dependent methyltransferase [Acidimicrobiia bacterium]|nr:MAG: class I SAM-dependent methyltransferase [Acidimicrobiia bacterium]